MDGGLEDYKGKYNSGLVIIFRLDEIHKACHRAKFNNDYESYYPGLISLFHELVRFMKNDEMKEHLEFWDQVKKDYFKIRKLNKEKKDVPAELIESFYYWEVKLVLIEQRCNVGMPSKEDSGL